MNYLKQNLVALLITGLMISSAQAGIKVEVNGCNLVQPALKSLSNVVDVLSRVRIPTISYVNQNNANTITTVYKTLPAIAAGAYLAATSVFCACVAYDYYKNSEGSFNTTAAAALSAVFAYGAGAYMFEPGYLAEQITEYIG